MSSSSIAMRKMFELDDRFQALQFRLNFTTTAPRSSSGSSSTAAARMEIIVIWLIIVK